MRSQDGNAANAARALGAVAWITGRDRLGFGFSGGSDGKEPTCNAGDLGSVPGSGRSPGGGNGSPLHYSCLENPMDRGASWAIVHRVAESDTTE